MGPLGWQETVFIFILALLIFGPKKLPELGKTLGKALTEFRRASSELKSTFDREMYALERETETLKKDVATASGVDSITSHDSSYNYDTYNYDSSSYDSGSQNTESSASTATETSTASASAPEGAQSTTTAQPEGTVAQGSVTAETKAPAPPEPAGSEAKVVAT